MLKYGKNVILEPKKLDPLNIDRQTVDLVPSGSVVLDIGCATGFMGAYLIKEKKCIVDGIELGDEEAKEAKKVLRSVFKGDVEVNHTLSQVKVKYDVVIASMIIEHLKDPWNALCEWKRLLKPDGILLMSTSNITHWSMRLDIMRGRFEYSRFGILDNTHLRFFNLNTFQRLLIDSGYNVEEVKIDPVGGGRPRISKFMSRFFPNMFAYQMLIKAKLI